MTPTVWLAYQLAVGNTAAWTQVPPLTERGTLLPGVASTDATAGSRGEATGRRVQGSTRPRSVSGCTCGGNHVCTMCVLVEFEADFGCAPDGARRYQ